MTIRMRLTLVYGGLFLVAGLALVALSYALVAQRLPDPAEPGSGPGLRTYLTLRSPDREILRQQLETAQVEMRDAALDSLLTQSVIALAVVVVAATALGWVVSGRMLRPLQKITETARRVADRNLHERIALQGPRDELTELADTFDGMLERLDRAFDGQRRFAGNAAHELRTPLTINRTLLEVALDRSDASADLRRLGETLLAVNARHERLIDGLLLLARADRPLEHPVPLDLAEIATHVIEQMRTPGAAGAPDGPDLRSCVRSCVRSCTVLGDPLLLERVVRNLLDNAVEYNRADGWVEVAVGPSPRGEAELVVVNTGPSLATYEIPGLFEPFRRGAERVRSDRGVGLGLSIVRSIVGAHGGRIDAEPRDTGGLVVRVLMPLAPTPLAPTRRAVGTPRL